MVLCFLSLYAALTRVNNRCRTIPATINPETPYHIQRVTSVNPTAGKMGSILVVPINSCIRSDILTGEYPIRLHVYRRSAPLGMWHGRILTHLIGEKDIKISRTEPLKRPVDAKLVMPYGGSRETRSNTQVEFRYHQAQGWMDVYNVPFGPY